MSLSSVGAGTSREYKKHVVSSSVFYLSVFVLLKDKHYKKIKDLEYLMNATREEAKEANLEHLTALWSAGNLTMKEFRRVWSTVNASQVVLSEKLRKVRSNFTQQVSSTIKVKLLSLL